MYVPRGKWGRLRLFFCALVGHRWEPFDPLLGGPRIEVCGRCHDGRYV